MSQAIQTIEQPTTVPGLVIRFDGPPGPEAGRFVEAEIDGASVRIGEWRDCKDGYWLLVLGRTYAAAPALLDACSLVIRSSVPDGKGGWHTPEKSADAVVAAVFDAVGEVPNTHQPLPKDLAVQGDGLVLSAGRTGASSETPTGEQLDQLQALCDAATKGPWEAHEYKNVADMSAPGTWVVERTVPARGFGVAKISKTSSDNPEADASLFAASRTAMPALIAEVRRLRRKRPAPADLLTACAPFDNPMDYRGVDDHVIVLKAYDLDGLHLTAGQVRAIKAAMTSPPARTANEQRIASLEAEVVTMRGALEAASPFVRDLGCLDDQCEHPECVAKKTIRSALTTTAADLEGKCVVDKKVLDKVCADLSCAKGSVTAENKHHWIVEVYARLDAIRKGVRG